MKTIRHIVVSAFFAAAVVAGFLFLTATVSIIGSFQLYPHDLGGSALFLIELVVAFFAASVTGLACFQRLHSRMH